MNGNEENLVADSIVYKFPDVKAIKPNSMGLSLAIVFVCIAIAFWHGTDSWCSLSSFLLLLKWFVGGYLFGLVIAILYNLFLFWILKILHRCRGEKNILF